MGAAEPMMVAILCLGMAQLALLTTLLLKQTALARTLEPTPETSVKLPPPEDALTRACQAAVMLAEESGVQHRNNGMSVDSSDKFNLAANLAKQSLDKYDVSATQLATNVELAVAHLRSEGKLLPSERKKKK